MNSPPLPQAKRKHKIVVRPLAPDDLPAYAALCATRPKLDAAAAERRAELIGWLAFHNPDAGDIPTIFVAAEGDRLVGHLGHMPTRFQIGDRRVLASFWHDLYIHPDLRDVGGQGFFTSMRLYKALEKASPNFVAMFWTNEINVQLQAARKYETAQFTRYVKRVDLDGKIEQKVPLAPAASVAKLLARTALRAADLAIRTAQTRRGAPPASIERIDAFDARFDRLADRIGPTLGISPVKNAAYLNWKYLQRPHLECAAYASLDAQGEATGFVVCVRSADDADNGIIADFSVDPSDRTTFIRLLDRAHGHFRALGVGRIECITTQPAYLAALEKFLYVARPPREPMAMYAVDAFDRPQLLRNLDNWHLVFGDSEGPF